MIKIAIVGSSSMEYDDCSEEIKKIIAINKPCTIISGGADGVDTIAYDIANSMNVETIVFFPKTHDWKGYKARNILIAQKCNKLYNLVIQDDKSYCYHHMRGGHIKSGGCWTENYVKQLGKQVMVIEI